MREAGEVEVYPYGSLIRCLLDAHLCGGFTHVAWVRYLKDCSAAAATDTSKERGTVNLITYFEALGDS